MKINFYSVGGLKDLADATAEIMAIYGVQLLRGSNGEFLPHEVPTGTVYLINKIYEEAGRMSLETECWYRNSHNQATKEIIKNEIVSEQAKPSERARLIKTNIFKIMHKITGKVPSSWGILRGVRPVKLAHRLLDKAYNKTEAREILELDYLVSSEKAQLILDVADYQRQYLSAGGIRRVSVYIGIPYCPTRCLYCSFPSYAVPKDKSALAPFMEALKLDLMAASYLIKELGLSVETVYIGGGTPTSLDSGYFAELLELTANHFIQHGTVEFTVEAGRPDSIDQQKISLMQQYGVSRISVNPQTMQEKTLNLIGRKHSVEDIINIFGKIRNYNFPVINMDIIAGLPGETVQDVSDSIAKILALQPDNLTVHALALKRGSLLKSDKGTVLLPDDDTVREMLEIVRESAAEAGMVPYYLYRQKYMAGQMENIGYTVPGAECIYNIQIMEERQTIIGVGPNSVTKAVARDFSLESSYFPKDITTYIKDLNMYISKREALLQALYR